MLSFRESRWVVIFDIIVTHDPIVAERCTKIYTIRDGQIENV